MAGESGAQWCVVELTPPPPPSPRIVAFASFHGGRFSCHGWFHVPTVALLDIEWEMGTAIPDLGVYLSEFSAEMRSPRFFLRSSLEPYWLLKHGCSITPWNSGWGLVFHSGGARGQAQSWGQDVLLWP